MTSFNPQAYNGGRGRATPSIRFFLNFSKTILHQHHQVTVAVAYPLDTF